MFEQAVLCPAPVRGWAVTLGFAGELVVVGCILAVPLIWPQLLPHMEATTWISAPSPPPPPLKEAPMPHVRPIRPGEFHPALVYASVEMRRPVVALDEPPAPEIGVAGGTATGYSSEGLRAAIESVMRVEVPRPAVRPAPASAAPKPAPAVQQIRVGGDVQSARLIHRVDPVYPALARQVRIAGTVELAGVIGTDGRIRELHVTSGHPLLVPAALEAVRQWIYRPTLLGGDPVEVLTTITVVFRLN